jgi:apolipoprotein N-acyltransferase
MCCWSKKSRLRRKKMTAEGPRFFKGEMLAHLSLRQRLPLAALAGALNVFSFAPAQLWWLQILLQILLFAVVLRAPNIKHAALTGWAYGLGWYVAGVSWIYISLHRFGDLPSWLAGLCVVLLALLLGSFVGLGMGAAGWLQKRRDLPAATMLLMVLPAALALSDWLRGWIFTGFPWIVSGYAYVDGPLSGFAPLLGVYGLGWLGALVAGALLLARSRRLVLLIPMALLVTGPLLKTLAWTTPAGAPISVRLLQGNVPQEMKFDEALVNDTLALYAGLIRSKSADLIVTPETAIPPSSILPPDYLPLLADYARSSGSTLALGIPLIDGPRRYTNSLIAVTPTVGPISYRYDKHHLVPYGEFIPWGFRWFTDLMQIPLGDFTAGAFVQKPFAVKDQSVLPNICYEDLFGEQIAAQLRSPDQRAATILLNLSNIACRSRACARWRPAGPCCARPIPVSRP